MRQVFVHQDEDGVWIAEVPSLPGCHSAGDTREEALDNVRDAIITMEHFLRSRDEPIPADPGTASLETVQ
ncbi:MAG: type II toxin-antitoxin system HicB family antitoxin [Phycisphaeraceae bacterium]|nr:MAG: type II toxin-antitoxin system HicB family antitoxin [Phycisphaeraceae bacterium]